MFRRNFSWSEVVEDSATAVEEVADITRRIAGGTQKTAEAAKVAACETRVAADKVKDSVITDEKTISLARAYFDETTRYNNAVIKNLFRIGLISTLIFLSIPKKDVFRY